MKVNSIPFFVGSKTYNEPTKIVIIKLPPKEGQEDFSIERINRDADRKYRGSSRLDYTI